MVANKMEKRKSSYKTNYEIINYCILSKEELTVICCDVRIWVSPLLRPFYTHGDSLVAQTVKRLTAIGETQVRSLGREDPLEKEMEAPSSILA